MFASVYDVVISSIYCTNVYIKVFSLHVHIVPNETMESSLFPLKVTIIFIYTGFIR